ncbi:5' exonuclease Apollo-like [Stylophora pistillata]|uniref:5' exonuclease Apollo-like n=1 Tax=Stylophora pistillata TaxID=50429 RepID=UPI000C03EFD5|nr:5' exonuclease Apollo-like [Stylophora pistillata]
MNGAVIPDTPIAVDFWRLRQCAHSSIFFLSHMHADHTVGLTSSWNTHPIYCSELTKKLVTAKIGVNSELVIGLPLDEPFVINLDEQGQETMSVTLIDANHCPGSVMFIFEGYFGKILYTGDFRHCERIATHSAFKRRVFDVLYLDNTYCDPNCIFPSRTEATINILEIIRRHSEYKIVMGLPNLGREMLLHTIAKAFRTWIGVDPLRRETLELIEMPNVFTSEIDKVRIRVVKNIEITRKNVQAWNSVEPTIAIIPTCLYVGGINPFANFDNVFVVPYSDHSSFEELQKFVQIVKPRRIIPIVHKCRLSPGETINARVNMNVFQSLMDYSLPQKYRIPHSVACFMSSTAQQPRKKKKIKATVQLCRRKAAKSKKPQGVVFSPSPEKKLVIEGNCELDTGIEDCSLSKEITGVQIRPVTSEGKSCVEEGKMSDKQLLSIAEEITEDENKVASSMYNKSSLSDSDEIERSNKSILNCEDTNDKEQMITEDEMNAIASPTIKCGKATSEPEGLSEMDTDNFSIDIIIPADEVNLVASSAVEAQMAGSKSEGNQHFSHVSSGEGFQGESMVQETCGNKNSFVGLLSGTKDVAGSQMKEEPMVHHSVEDRRVKHVTSASAKKTKVSPDEHLSSPKRSISNYKIKRRDMNDDVITSAENTPLKNLSLKRKFQDIDANSCENVVSEVDSRRSDMKFNIYTGSTCDFARKVLDDLAKSAPRRDK